MPKAITACGSQIGVSLAYEVWPRLNEAKANFTIDQARNPVKRRGGDRGADLEQAPRSGREMREHERDPDVAAGAQRHRGPEGEGRGHEIGAVLPGDRDIGRKPRDDVRERPHRDVRQHQQRQRGKARGAEPAVETAEPVDEIEHLPQRRRRRCLARRDPGLVHELRFISAR